MCYSIAYLEKKAKRLAERYRDLLAPDWSVKLLSDDLPQYYFVSGFSHPSLPLVQMAGISMFEWGLIPPWTRDAVSAEKIRKGTLNAVGETIFKKPSFKDSIISRRGLLPVNGFFEWQSLGGSKHPYFVGRADGEIFSLGCVYAHWTDRETGELRHTFSILTTPANALMEKIHNLKKRMPLVVRKEDEADWTDPGLDPTAIRSLIRPLEDGELRAYPVSRMLNNVRNDRNIPEALHEVQSPGLQAGLFE